MAALGMFLSFCKLKGMNKYQSVAGMTSGMMARVKLRRSFATSSTNARVTSSLPWWIDLMFWLITQTFGKFGY